MTNKTVSYEQIANQFWREKSLEKFSLWAITKAVEKLRFKFKSLGVKKEVIKTVRGQGYVLYD